MKIATLLSSVTGLLLLLCPCIHAQTSDSTKAKRIHTVKLEKYKFDKLPAAISGIEVSMSLWDSTCLGFVQVGLANKKLRAQPDTNFTNWLQTYLNHQYGESYSPSGKPLLLVIQELRIGERTWTTKEMAFVRLVAAAYVRTGDNQYRLANTIDTALGVGGLDVTKKHGKHIGEAFHLLLERALLHTDTDEPVQSLEAIRSKETARFNMPILSATEYNSGVYLTYEDFKNNRPAFTDFRLRPDKKKKMKLYRVEDGKHIQVDTFWGVCSNNELYKWHATHLTAIEKVDHAFIVSNYLDASNRRNKAIFWGGIAGGVGGGIVGGVVGASAGAAAGGNSSNAHVCNVRIFPYLRGNPEACALDMYQGELTF